MPHGPETLELTPTPRTRLMILFCDHNFNLLRHPTIIWKSLFIEYIICISHINDVTTCKEYNKVKRQWVIKFIGIQHWEQRCRTLLMSYWLINKSVVPSKTKCLKRFVFRVLLWSLWVCRTVYPSLCLDPSKMSVSFKLTTWLIRMSLLV